MLWVKAFHIVFMVTWFAGLFYLPRLFVYHAMSEDAVEHRALQGDGAQALLRHHDAGRGAHRSLTGLALWLHYGIAGDWLHAKLALVGGAHRLSPVVRRAREGVSRRPQHARPRVVSLVQRSAGAVPDRHRRSSSS